MICYRCGRELPDKSPYCKGCGTQLRRHKKVRSASVLDTLKNNVIVGQHTIRTWQLIVILFLTCALLVAGLYVVPPVLERLEAAKPVVEEPEESQEQYDPGDIIDYVSGDVIDCTVPMDDLTVSEECAYADGSWQRDCVVGERVSLRFIRRPIAESWVNTHIFQLYPDVLEVDQFAEAINVSGYTSARIQFASQNAPDCVIEALCVNDGSFDYLFIVEMPYDMFEENSIFVDDWFNNLILVDAQTGTESYNPAAMITVSAVDAIVED